MCNATHRECRTHSSPRIVFAIALVAAWARADASIVVDLSADADVQTSSEGVVTSWGDQSGNHFDAVVGPSAWSGPMLTTSEVNGRFKPVLQFNGGLHYLVSPPHVPSTGTLFMVVRDLNQNVLDRRVIGWSDRYGQHGVEVITKYWSGEFVAVARQNWTVGDMVCGPASAEMEVVTMSWGLGGVTLERRLATGEVFTFSNPAISWVSDGGNALHIGSPGDPDAPWYYAQPFQGELAALRLYDEQLGALQRGAIASTLYARWVGIPFVGSPGDASCYGDSVAALPAAYKRGLMGAAEALGFASVRDLQRAIVTHCRQ